jgi:hypothetical protein
VGPNWTVNAADWPELSVTGSDVPVTVKPAPVSVAELMVTGVVPDAVSVTVWLAEELTATLPNARLTGLALSVEFAAFNCSENVPDMLPDVAVRVAVCEVVTEATVAVKGALVAFAGTVTDAGTATAELLLARFTVMPFVGALSVTTQLSAPAPVMEALPHDTPLSPASVKSYVELVHLPPILEESVT